MSDLTSDLLTEGPESSPPPARRGPAWLRLTALAVGVLAVVIVGGILAKAVLDRVLDDPPPDYPGPGESPVVVEVVEGETAAQIGQTLFEADVVASVEAFTRAANRNEESTGIQVGFYNMLTKMQAGDALDRLLDSEYRVGDAVVVPEGWTVDQVFDTAAKQLGIPREEFEAIERDSSALPLPSWDMAPATNRLEGFLFPATYPTDPGTTAESLTTAMVEKFNAVTGDIDFAGRAPANGVTPYEALVVASIAEKEAGTDEDIGKVARVIYNRLELGMPLQMDSTVNYALGKSDITLSDSDVQVDSPYNTYQNTGLPPTPISNPGEKALVAAIDPPEGDWIYFVLVSKDGSSFFTDDYDEFLAAKKKAKEEGIF